MFGTFAEEKPGEKIVYGLVEDVKSFNPFWLQVIMTIIMFRNKNFLVLPHNSSANILREFLYSIIWLYCFGK